MRNRLMKEKPNSGQSVHMTHTRKPKVALLREVFGRGESVYLSVPIVACLKESIPLFTHCCVTNCWSISNILLLGGTQTAITSSFDICFNSGLKNISSKHACVNEKQSVNPRVKVNSCGGTVVLKNAFLLHCWCEDTWMKSFDGLFAGSVLCWLLPFQSSPPSAGGIGYSPVPDYDV